MSPVLAESRSNPDSLSRLGSEEHSAATDAAILQARAEAQRNPPYWAFAPLTPMQLHAHPGATLGAPAMMATAARSLLALTAALYLLRALLELAGRGGVTEGPEAAASAPPTTQPVARQERK